jgi:hypothetical protein
MANLSGAAGGAVSGATFGGSIGGPLGAGLGGLVGGVAGLFGSKKKRKKYSSLDKRQQHINETQYNAILGQGPLADMYNYNPDQTNEYFNKTVANPAYQQFNENIVPSITGQFRSQGLMNSSYAGDALSRAGRDVQTGLDAERARMQYGSQQAARSAKQNAVENIQNRQNFAYGQNTEGSGFNIDQILSTITPEARNSLIDYFKNYRG